MSRIALLRRVCLSFELWFVALVAAGCDRGAHSAATRAQGTNAGSAPTSLVPTTAPVAPFTRAPQELVWTPRRVKLGSQPVRLPIDLITCMPVVTFDLADGSRQRMIIDTGADTMIMTSSLATAGHLTTRPSDISAIDATGTADHVPIALVTHLQLGAATFEDFDAITEPQLFAGVDALLGYPVWKDVLLTIDYPNRVIIIERGSLPPPDGQMVLPLRFDDRNRLTLPATLNGRETWLNLDTGWGAGGSLELTAAHAAEVTWASAPKATMATNAASGAIAEKLGRLSGDLAVGRYRFTQPIAGTNAGLGADILAAAGLANFTLTLDLHNMRVRLKRPNADPIRSGSVLVSGFDCDLRSTPMRVLNVLPDSGADHAGLRAGDLLFTIDQRPARDGLFAHQEGDYSVELSRDERPMKLTFPMTTLVP